MAGKKLDDALEYIGKYGRYQIATSVIVTILGTWFPAWHTMGLIFMADKPESYECVRWSGGHGGAALDAGGTVNAALHGGADQENAVNHDSNRTSPDASDSECTGENPGSSSGSLCTEWEYCALYNESTIVTDFDLVCDRKILAETAQSIFLAGMLVGAVVFGHLSDVFGRKIILLGTCVAHGVFGIVVAFLWTYTSVVILWFLIGMFAQGYNQVQFVMIMELFPSNCRTLAGSLNSMFWGFGIVTLTPIAYALRNWRHMQLAISAPCLLAIPLWPILDESARWLLSKGRTDDAQKILRKMARWNGVAPPSGGFLIKENPIDPPSYELSKNLLDPVFPTLSQKKCTLLDVLRTRRVLLNICIVYFAWYVSAVTYYGASLNSSNLAGNKYTNFLFLGLAEIPGYAIIHFTMTWWGRRPSLCLFFLVSGAASIVTAFLPEQTADGTDLTIAITVTAMLVKLCIVCAYSIDLICCTEVLPTSVRNIGFGVGAVCGCVGFITAPFVIYLDDFASFLPLTVFGGLCILAAILVLILPETGNKPLPESLEDARNIGKKVSKTPEPNTAVCTPTTDAKIKDGSKVDAL
ncbi:organic cation transporter protein-like [Patiria miniata]|uniref:Major facilitator superfamily (MFS) profile domain-containing protein n=1 Tax=Patiria miniata TaxID=46514 RepID=A0A913ZHY1_PATMI|nr:organic cation transporter protein-like [Patiria miniata]